MTDSYTPKPGYSYFCPCGQLFLTLLVPLTTLPERQLDHTFVVDESLPHIAHFLTGTRYYIIRYDGGYEQRIALLCRRCSVECAYALQTAPGYLYLNPTLFEERTVTVSV
ncbi:ER exit protein [Schizosaccharomyces osmophilus]|uniref:ER exit protein n=1 Tax=Schizosaccharomyces osmophilus TaxID=2545709 RepID=A0AAF0AUV3_9SCHI|nr:ER exit protein [Schizosaccharomyces osmophilus]WBW71300.1 ER exit protein [Schizosaccharomyces osmophilus]